MSVGSDPEIQRDTGSQSSSLVQVGISRLYQINPDPTDAGRQHRRANAHAVQFVGKLIDRLRPRWFTWRDNPDAEPEPGFFAQEVHKVWRWAVTKGRGRKGRKDFKPWQMDNAKLIPLLVAELQSLRKRVAELEAR